MRVLFLLVALLPCFAAAQQKVVHFSSGTGFFITPYGDLVTNAHVVKACPSGKVELRGAVEAQATVKAMDEAYDLALLQASVNSPGVGRLLVTDRTIEEGDEVMVMGYPLDAAQDGKHRVALAEIVGIEGPTGQPQWLQFSSSAQKGNSGGPLLDTAGNVIGVVTGKSEMFATDANGRERSLGQSDIAVNLEALKQFLESHRVRYQQTESLSIRSARAVESAAQRFIVNIRCVTGEELVR